MLCPRVPVASTLFSSNITSALLDDVDTFERNQLSLNARVTEWVQFRRGLYRERTDIDGLRVSHITDERAQWHHYKRVMSQV